MNELKLSGEPAVNFGIKFIDVVIGGGQNIFLLIFIIIFLIQFLLVFLLYKANKQSAIKITDLESLLGATADRVLSIRERTDAVTYQDVVTRLKSGQKVTQIVKEVNVNITELEALERILKTID